MAARPSQATSQKGAGGHCRMARRAAIWYKTAKREKARTMSGVVTLLAGLGLLGFGAAVLIFPNASDDPYKTRKFGFAKGSASQIVFGSAAIIMGAFQLLYWFGWRP